MSPLFGFVQIELPGTVSLEDGRYLDRQPDAQRVLVLETEGGLPPARRKRRKPRNTGPDENPATSVPVTTFTAVRTQLAFNDETEAVKWLSGVESGETPVDPLLEEARALLDRALAADAAASGNPWAGIQPFDGALGCRIGIADGDRISEGRYLRALNIDIRGGEAGRRRAKQTRPTQRIAHILGAKDKADSCEFLVPRIRVDLEAGRLITAALVIESAVKATIIETEMSLEDSDHEADLDRLEASLPALEPIREKALSGDGAWQGLADEIEAPLAIAERVIRRRRVLNQ